MENKPKKSCEEAADEFARNFYLERQSFYADFLKKIDRLDLNNSQKEEIRKMTSTLLTDVFYTILTGLDGETSIGDSGQQSYSIYDATGNLISDCGELEAEAYAYFHEHKFEHQADEANHKDQ